MKMKIHTGTPRNVGGLCTVRSKAAIHHRSKYWMPTKSRYPRRSSDSSFSIPWPFLSDRYRLGISMFDARSPTNRRLNGGKLVAPLRLHRSTGTIATWEIDRLTDTAIARLIGWTWYPICCANWRVAHYRDIIVILSFYHFILPSLDNFNRNWTSDFVSLFLHSH